MGKTEIPPENFDEYIASFPPNVREILLRIRETISKAAPNAEEAIKQAIPTFVLNGNLVHFGGFKNHIGFYPTPSGMKAFKEPLSKYSVSKGSVKFPIDESIPYPLTAKIVKFRVKENEQKSAS